MEMSCQENSFLLLENCSPTNRCYTDESGANSPEKNEMGPGIIGEHPGRKVYRCKTWRLSAARRPSC